ncbi:MAG: hypothetical protein KF715_19665 [Candidatus Didemnitutus sp.]|nr:hypothetical protein [Candidatus Didemnitutus sp.]
MFAVTLTVRADAGTTLLQVAIVLRQHRLFPRALLLRPADEPYAVYWILVPGGRAQIGALRDQLAELSETIDVRAEEWNSDAPLPHEPSSDFWKS